MRNLMKHKTQELLQSAPENSRASIPCNKVNSKVTEKMKKKHFSAVKSVKFFDFFNFPAFSMNFNI